MVADDNSKKYVIVKNAIPEDAKFIRVIEQNGVIGFVVESSEFDELKIGDDIPEHPDPLFQEMSIWALKIILRASKRLFKMPV